MNHTSGSRSSSIADFQEAISICNLFSLPVSGQKFTFSNKRLGVKEFRAQLDRFLVTKEFADLFATLKVTHDFTYSSNHKPIVLHLYGIKSRCVSSFKFEAMLLRHPDFLILVRHFWESLFADRSKLLNDKLLALQTFLKHWSTQTFGTVKKQMSRLKGHIALCREEFRSEQSTMIEMELTDKLDEWTAREEIYWKQCSRTQWLLEGDRNTKFISF